MPGHVVSRPDPSRRARWHARLADEQLGAVGLVTAPTVGLISGLATANPGLGVGVGFGVVVVDIVGRRIARRLLRPRGEHLREITDKPGRADLATARAAIKRTERAWPQLGVLADEQPAPVLAEALWQLAGDLRRRAELYDALDAARQLLTDLPPAEPARVEVEHRRAQLTDALDRVQDSISGRLDRLDRLADACVRQAIAQAARLRLADLHRRTERLLAAESAGSAGDGRDGAGDPAAELAERTEAVISAYRELTGTRLADDGAA